MHREEGDDRRHRSKCYYFSRERKVCRLICEKCSGAAHCDSYKERIAKEEKIELTPRISLKSAEQQLIERQTAHQNKTEELKYCIARLLVGTKIRHNRYGEGVIVGRSNNMIKVRFENKTDIVTLEATRCLWNGLIEIV